MAGGRAAFLAQSDLAESAFALPQLRRIKEDSKKRRFAAALFA